jgi:hypothetical protein
MDKQKAIWRELEAQVQNEEESKQG